VKRFDEEMNFYVLMVLDFMEIIENVYIEKQPGDQVVLEF